MFGYIFLTYVCDSFSPNIIIPIMYNYNNNKLINDPSSQYGSVTEVLSQKVHIWIITSEYEVFIKNLGKIHSSTKLKDIIFEYEKTHEALAEITTLTNSLCKEDDLEQIYTLDNKSEHSKTYGYILKLRVEPPQKSAIENSSNGTFIDYKELPNIFSDPHIDIDLKEGLYSLISHLEEKSSFFPNI